ncbi:hypothetical protein Nepgr_012212 [Nepenthes gracilis]|uniref:Uncharacterized protein n=1 Tax=Nepenthes gracilis TaxID=150966 RepID=A0AAD3SGK5_NEPGR|nr:hypothetical protein Nepgr_012212 [Nepenthes gracilis]
MGAGLLTLAPFIPPVGLVNPKPPISPNYKPLSKVRCSSTRAGSGSRQPWDSNGETIRSERFKFNGGYEFSGDGDGSIGFRSNEKRRKWWSDYASEINEEDEDDDEDEEGLGSARNPVASIGFSRYSRPSGGCFQPLPYRCC